MSYTLTIPASIVRNAKTRASDEGQAMKILKATSSAAMNLGRMEPHEGWVVRAHGAAPDRHWTGRPLIVAALVHEDGSIKPWVGFRVEP